MVVGVDDGALEALLNFPQDSWALFHPLRTKYVFRTCKKVGKTDISLLRRDQGYFTYFFSNSSPIFLLHRLLHLFIIINLIFTVVLIFFIILNFSIVFLSILIIRV